MNLWNVTGQDDLDLDLLDVMLDLDPGILAWTPPRTELVRSVLSSSR